MSAPGCARCGVLLVADVVGPELCEACEVWARPVVQVERVRSELYRARVLRHAYRSTKPGAPRCPSCGPGVACRCTVDDVADFNRRQCVLPGVDLNNPGPALPAAPGGQGRLF